MTELTQADYQAALVAFRRFHPVYNADGELGQIDAYQLFTKEEFAAIKSALTLAARVPQTMDAPVQHWSDCAVHNEPAYPNGSCDCGGFNGADSGIAEPCPVSAGESASLSPIASDLPQQITGDKLGAPFTPYGLEQLNKAIEAYRVFGMHPTQAEESIVLMAANYYRNQLLSDRTQPAITDSMVERAAKAINDRYDTMDWDELSEYNKDVYRHDARAALSAALGIK
ncbi:unnamed protein product [Sphagnum balticum]